MIGQILFFLLLVGALVFFGRNIAKIRRNILLGKDLDRSDRKWDRLKVMLRVAFGQTKMTKRPLSAFFHFLIYIGFIIMNIEILEIIIDGLTGSHRIFQVPLGNFYPFVIATFEVLGIMVVVACVVFLARRYIAHVKRLNQPELKGFPQKDAATILIIELFLMSCFFTMNAADRAFQHSLDTGMPVSSLLAPLFDGMSENTVHTIERTAWWLHIIGILSFLNYLPYSKHFHIMLAFPNTYYSDLEPKGKFDNMASVTTEVQLMMDPSAPTPEGYEPPTGFGVKDVQDLYWKNLMDAYSCTECGRCTSVCPANITGKKLSPRKIMMDTRDRLEEVGENINKNGGEFVDDGKNLHSYISEEELWACTTCNACVEACPVNINPLDIIYYMRQYLVMEQSKAPAELNNMFSNTENNGAPWQFPPSDRAKWTEG